MFMIETLLAFYSSRVISMKKSINVYTRAGAHVVARVT